MTGPTEQDYQQRGLIVIPYLNAEGNVYQVNAWRLSGRPVSTKLAEEIGEDHGFFDPRSKQIEDGGRRITEDFTGELCDHQWGMRGHFGRNPYGTFTSCVKCGVHTRIECRRRSDKVSYIYDGWELRPHVYEAWCKRGPAPNGLSHQDHHFPSLKHQFLKGGIS